METKEFRETIKYLQEDNNCSIDSWRSFLADVIDVVMKADEEMPTLFNIVEELSNLRIVLNKLKR